MNYSELSNRYATALFTLAKTDDEQKTFLADLVEVAKAFTDDSEVRQFIDSPLIRAEAKIEVLKKALNERSLNPDFLNFVLLLAKKSRLSLASEIVMAYQARLDEKSHVKRGHVHSAAPLNEKQKGELQKAIEKYTHSKVVLDYAVDKSLVGGLTAQVGSVTFDDSLSAHLVRMKEDLTRSAHS
jgi:F-type H+-transporting ATPase subunit delta